MGKPSMLKGTLNTPKHPRLYMGHPGPGSSEMDTSYAPLSVHGSSSPAGSQTKKDTEIFKTSRWQKWSAPATMIPGLLVGMGLAVGHHFFYWSLDGTKAGDIERQQWSLQVGSFFATAFGTVIRLTVGTAYLQYLWLRLKSSTITLKSLDQAFEAMTDIRVLFNYTLGSLLPGAYFTILVFWCTHISVLFPPATLSTKETRAPGLIYVPVPSLMYTNTSAFYKDEYYDPPTELSGQLPDKDAIDAYIENGEWLSDKLEEVLREAEITAPVLLEPAIDYEYEVVAPLPWLQCQQLDATALQPFKTEIERSLVIQLYREVLDLPDDDTSLDVTFVYNATLLNDNLYFSYQTAVETVIDAGGSEIHNVSESRSGYIDYIAWPGTIDLLGKPQKMDKLFQSWRYLDWPQIGSRDLNKFTTLLDGSLYLVSRNASGSDAIFTKCELYNATVEIDVKVEGRKADVWLASPDDDLGAPLSANAALWSGDGDAEYPSPKWAALALNAWMTPLYRNVFGMSLYTRETGSNHSYFQDPPLVRGADLTPANYDWEKFADGSYIEEAAHKYALSLMSGELERGYTIPESGTGWFRGEVESKFIGMHIIYTYEPRNLILAYALMSAAAAVVVLVGTLSFLRNNRVSFDEKPTTLASAMQSASVRTRFLETVSLRI